MNDAELSSRIECYQEVLAVEPTSRAFFPLARLLLSARRPDEALSVLQTGLASNPDHLEARLLALDVAEELGRQDVAEAMRRSVADVLSAYPRFWSGALRDVAVEMASGSASVSPDAAAAALILSSWAEGRGVSLATILERGVISTLSRPEASRERVAERPPERPQAERRYAEPRLEPSYRRPPDRAPDHAPGRVPEREREWSRAEQTSGVQPYPFSPLGNFQSRSAQERVAEPVPPQPAPSPVPPIVPPIVSQIGWEQTSVDFEEFKPERRAPSPRAQAAPVDPMPEPSLRTATMAELLASQGERSAAMDIYRELIASAEMRALTADPAELPRIRADRERLVARLTELAAIQSAESGRCATAERTGAEPDLDELVSGMAASGMAAGRVPDGQEAAGRPYGPDSFVVTNGTRRKLLTALESLAGRLEARSARAAEPDDPSA